MGRHFTTLGIPATAFGLAVVLSLLAGPASPVQALRLPRQETGPADPCHEFTDKAPMDCRSKDNNDPVQDPGDCTRVRPADVRGRFVVGEKRWYIERIDDGSLDVVGGTRDGATVMTPEGVTTRTRLGKLVANPPKGVDCCHDLKSELSANASALISLSTPMDPLDFNRGRIRGRMEAERDIDGCGRKALKLSEKKFRDVELTFVRKRDGAGTLVDELSGTVQEEVNEKPVPFDPLTPDPEVPGQETSTLFHSDGTASVLKKRNPNEAEMLVPLVLDPVSPGSAGSKFEKSAKLGWAAKAKCESTALTRLKEPDTSRTALSRALFSIATMKLEE
jgi:hypothetical protein